jgi:Uma2 family endonuclease
MNTNVTVKDKKSSPSSNGKTEIEYPSEEKKKLGETDYQHIQISILEQALRLFLADRKDVYLASDLIVYYEEGNPNRRFAPDIMICFGVEKKKRRTYKLWEEKVVPRVVIEVVSKETWQKDVTTKRRLYERLGVEEYFVVDPEYKYLPAPMFAYRLEFGELVRQNIAENRISIQALGLELVNTGKEFRVFDPETDEFLPTSEDLQAKVKRLEAELARLKKQSK